MIITFYGFIKTDLQHFPLKMHIVSSPIQEEYRTGREEYSCRTIMNYLVKQKKCCLSQFNSILFNSHKYYREGCKQRLVLNIIRIYTMKSATATHTKREIK